MLKIRRPLGRLIFNMGIAIPGKTVFLIETPPWTWPKVNHYEFTAKKMAWNKLWWNLKISHIFNKMEIFFCSHDWPYFFLFSVSIHNTFQYFMWGCVRSHLMSQSYDWVPGLLVLFGHCTIWRTSDTKPSMTSLVGRVSIGQGKVREIPDLAKVREKSGNFVEGQGKNEY